jgi:general secretion pathway protein D
MAAVNIAGGGSTGGGGRGGGGGGGGAGGAGGAGGIMAVTRTNVMTSIDNQVRAFFVAAGVDLNTNNPANYGKSLFWNDRKGMLYVHSTESDLDIIARALEALNQAPPQVNIKTKFVEITQNDNNALGFNWYLGNVLMGGGAIAGSGGTQPTLNGASTTANPLGAFPTPNTPIAPATTDGNITSGLRNTFGPSAASIPTVATFTGLLTDPQFRVAINALQQRDGVDLMTAPEVTTESGRQAEIQAVDLQTIVTSTGINTGGTSTAAPTSGGTVVAAAAPLISTPGTTLLPFGPTLDVIPYVSADDFTVQMTIIPTVTEFIGYDSANQFVPQATSGGQSITAVLPLPHFRVRQVVTSASVWDAQTLVIGGLITDSVTKINDQVPVLGDIPLLGRLFQSQSNSKSKKNLLIFVTPTIVNPDGTRFHSDDEMPFAQTSFPPQKAIVK